MVELKEFGEMAVLKINHKKTKIVTKNIQEQEIDELLQITNFREGRKVKYLGILFYKENKYSPER